MKGLSGLIYFVLQITHQKATSHQQFVINTIPSIFASLYTEDYNTWQIAGTSQGV